MKLKKCRKKLISIQGKFKKQKFNKQMKERKALNFRVKLLQLVKEVFLQPSAFSKDSELYLFVSELTIFCALFHFDCLAALQKSLTYPAYMALAINLTILFVRILMNASLIRLVYIPCLVLTQFSQESRVQTNRGVAILNIILLVVNLLIDAVSNVDFSFISKNPYSQTLNFNKILHNLSMLIIATLLITKTQTVSMKQKGYFWTWGLHILCTFMIIILIVLKVKSRCKSQFAKKVLLRFYFLCLFYHVQQIFLNLLSLQLAYLGQKITFILLSQLIFTLVDRKFLGRKLNLNVLLENSQEVPGTLFKLLCCHYSSDSRDQRMKAALQEFLRDKIEDKRTEAKIISSSERMNEDIKNSPSVFEEEMHSYQDERRQKHQQKQLLIAKAFRQFLLSKINSSPNKCESTAFLSLLLGEVHQVNNGFLLSKYLFEKAKNQSKTWHLLDRLCAMKAQYAILKILKKEHTYDNDNGFRDFLNNQKFIELIIKSSSHYEGMWKNLATEALCSDGLKKNLRKMMTVKAKISEFYSEEFEKKYKQLLLIYSQYLFIVEKDVSKANQIFRTLESFPEIVVHQNLDNKLYIKLLLEEQKSLTIQKLSKNAKKLLGYQSCSLQGLNISALLPKFFNQIHETLIKQNLSQFTKSNLLHNSVIIKHAEGFYIPAELKLKMNISEEGLTFIEGYIHLLQDLKNAYNYKNYLFVRYPGGIIIEASKQLTQELHLEGMRDPYCGDYFTQYNPRGNCQFQKNKLFLNTSEQIREFQVFKSLATGKEERAFYNLYMEKEEMQGESYSSIDEIYDTKELKAYPLYTMDQSTGNYLEEKKSIISRKTNKKIKILIYGCFLMAGLILCLKIFQMIKHAENQAKQQNTLENFKEIVWFYDSFTYVNINIYTLRFIRQYGFSVSTIDIPKYIEVYFKLVKSNAYLSKYSKKIYNTAPPTNAISGNKTASQLASGLIAGIRQPFYLSFDVEMSQKQYELSHQLMMVYYNGASEELMETFREELSAAVDSSGNIQVMLACIMFILAVTIVVILSYVKNRQQRNEHEAVETLKILQNNEEECHRIAIFIQDLTGQTENNNLPSFLKSSMLKEESSIFPSMKEKTHNGSFVSAQNSNRNLVGESLTMNTLEAEEIINNIKDKKKTASHNKTGKKKSFEKIPLAVKFIIFWSVCLLLIVAFPIVEAIDQKSSNYIFLDKSLINVIGLYNKFEALSNTFNLYLDSIFYPESRNLIVQNIENLEKEVFKDVSMPEVGNPYFKNFSAVFKDFMYRPVCEYLECQPEFYTSTNLAFPVLLHKIEDYFVDHLDGSDFKNKTFEARALVYAFRTLQVSVNMVVDSFLGDLGTYDQQKQIIASGLAIVQITCNILALLLIFLHFAFNIVPELNYRDEILDLVKEQSYISNQLNKK